MKFFKKTKVFAIIFYVLAAIFCLYTIFSIVTTISYLSSVASSGMYMDVGFSDMLNAFMSTVGPNLFYTLVYFFCGYMIQLVSGELIPEDQEFEEHVEASTSAPAVSEQPQESLAQEAQEYDSIAGEEAAVEANSEDLDDVVATIADIEDEFVEIGAPEEVLELPETEDELLIADTSVDDKSPVNDEIENLEEGIAESFDLAEPDNKEVDEVELENEEDEA